MTAFVPAYDASRTFALERIETLGVLDEHFDPRPLPREPFANSLGVNSGSPELVEIEFDGSAADYVAEREWHRSQEIVRRDDGSILLRLCVCNDWALRAWILGFGAAARAVMPESLVSDIATEIERAGQRYSIRPFRFEMLRMTRAAGVTASDSRAAG
jgi:predicted DNA-binding transcriptional regulator YafY